jgi:signal transduction histidine kinase
MKLRSLISRLIITVICIEAALALCITLAAIDYQRRESLRAFDIMLHGRADSVLGAVQDAEDTGDNVLLDKTSLNIPPQDKYEVREENGYFIGSSEIAHDELSSRFSSLSDPEVSIKSDGEAHRMKIGSTHYRVLVLHGLRLIDPDEPGTGANGKGTLHHVVVYYASPTRPVHDAVWHAVRFFALADTLALLLSIAGVALLIRRGLRPLGDLATQASLVSARQWNFNAPASAYELHELQPLALALDTALQGLERAFRQQRTFVNDAAHELKTAVTLLKSSLQLLTLRERTKNEYQVGIEGCLSDCGRMEDLVQRMLLLASVEQHDHPGVVATAATAHLAESLQQSLTQLASAALLKRIELKAEITDSRSVRLTEEDASTLLTNLIVNAIQHSHPSSTIVARLTSLNESQTQLAIIDQGEGIAPEHVPFLFERFYRTDASRSRNTGGTGLGLAICKAIVEANGGTIRLESEFGRGTTVTLVLPVAPGIAFEQNAPTSQDANVLSNLQR